MNQKLKFLFFIERDLHIPILKPVWEYIRANNIGQTSFFTLPYKKPNANYPGQGLTPSNILLLKNSGLNKASDPYKYKPDITYLADHNFQYVEGHGKIVNLGHGTISKGYFYQSEGISKRENFADLICVPGYVHKDLLKKIMYKKIEVTGMPKLDKIFTEKINKNEFYKRYDLDSSKKTVLFAPTFNYELSILSFMSLDLRKYIPEKYNIIIKLHGATCSLIKEKYEKYSKQESNVYFSNDNDIAPLLAVSDVLVSDVSSAIYEFSALSKPAVIFDSPLQKDFENYKEDDLEYKFRDIGFRFSDVLHLPKILNKVTKLNFKIGKKRNSIANNFISVRDGSSAKRVVESSLKLKSLSSFQDVTVILNNSSLKNTFAYHKLNGFRGFQFGKNIPAIQFEYIFGNEPFNICEALKIILPKVKTKYIVYIDTSYNLSPFLIQSLRGHFHYDQNLKIVVPLVCDNNANPKLQPRSLSIQLGYKFQGESVEHKLSYSHCFAAEKDFLKSISCKQKSDNNSFIKSINKSLKGKRLSKIALDAVIFPMEMNENLDSKVKSQLNLNSMFQNLYYLNKNIFQRIIKFQMNRLDSWNFAKKFTWFIDLGSFYKSQNDFKKALLYFKKGEKIREIQNKNALGRLYFHMGETFRYINRTNNAKKYFEKCVEVIPNHIKANEFLKRGLKIH